MARESSLDDRHPSSELGALDRRPQLLDIPDALSRRVIIDRVRPVIDAGRFPIKRTADEPVDASADVFADGHDVLVAVLRHRPAHGEWAERPMSLVAAGTDEWSGQFHVDAIGWHEYQIIAWVDRFCTWRRDLQVRAAAGQDVDVDVELLEGSMLVRDAAARAEQIGAGGHDAAELLAEADALSESSPAAERVDRALEEKLGALMMTYADRSRATTSDAWRI